MTVRAKLKVTSITDFGGGVKTLRFDAQYDDSIPEDQKFEQYTPTAHAEFRITNPAALAQFEVGKSYYVDFTPAP